MRKDYLNFAVLFTGSLLFQIIQIGSFPILIVQLLEGGAYEHFVIGLFAAISWISVIVLSPFVPGLIARFGERATLHAAFITSLAGLALLLAPVGLACLAAASILLGVGLILRWIACDTLVANLSPRATRGRLIGLHEALMGFGIALGPILFTLGDLRAVTWLSIAAIVVGQACLMLTDMRFAHQDAEEETATAGTSVYRLIVVALAAALVAGFIESASIALFPVHFGHFGFPLAEAAILVSAFGFGGTLLQPPLGYIADRRGYAFAQILCGVAIACACAALIAFAANYMVLLAAMFLLGGAGGGLNTLAVIEAGNELNGARMPAAMTAIAVLYTVGGVAGPILSASLLSAAGNFGMVLLFGTISLMLVMTVALHAARRMRPS
ncbi:MAG: MFS transporter [Nitratireductor sp.]|nr:MFS transporter [Nitratireductor sp.]